MSKKDNQQFINASCVSEFVFGDPEAKTDELLVYCPQMLRGVQEFLRGKKNIVIGERGVGKSALFKLLCEGRYRFADDTQDRQSKYYKILPIEDELAYITISNIIEERFVDKSGKPHGKYRFLWEIYILSRCIEQLSSDHGVEKEVQELNEDFEKIFGISPEKKFGLQIFLRRLN